LLSDQLNSNIRSCIAVHWGHMTVTTVVLNFNNTSGIPMNLGDFGKTFSHQFQQQGKETEFEYLNFFCILMHPIWKFVTFSKVVRLGVHLIISMECTESWWTNR